MRTTAGVDHPARKEWSVRRRHTDHSAAITQRMQSATRLTHDRVGTADRVEEDTVELLPWSLEPIPWTTTVVAEWIEAPWIGPGHPCSRVTGEPGGSDSLGDPKLGKDRLDARRQRLSRPVPGKYLTFKQNNAQALPDAPDRGGRTRRSAAHDHDIDVRRGTLAHGSKRLLSRRAVMLPGAILSQEDIRQVGVGHGLLRDPHPNPAHVVTRHLLAVPPEQVETMQRIALQGGSARLLRLPEFRIVAGDDAVGED